MTPEDALLGVQEWESRHRHSAKAACLSRRFGSELDALHCKLSREQLEDGARRWDDYERARREEKKDSETRSSTPFTAVLARLIGRK